MNSIIATFYSFDDMNNFTLFFVVFELIEICCHFILINEKLSQNCNKKFFILLPKSNVDKFGCAKKKHTTQLKKQNIQNHLTSMKRSHYVVNHKKGFFIKNSVFVILLFIFKLLINWNIIEFLTFYIFILNNIFLQ